MEEIWLGLLVTVSYKVQASLKEGKREAQTRPKINLASQHLVLEDKMWASLLVGDAELIRLGQRSEIKSLQFPWKETN